MISLISILVFCKLVIQDVDSEETLRPVNNPPWGPWLEGVTNKHLTDLTCELYRDTYQKMKIVKSNAVFFEKSPLFAVGVIASNIYALFDRMIKIYKDTSNIHKTRNKDWDYRSTSINDTLKGFGMIQGIYHQIRLEKTLFLELLQKEAVLHKQRTDDFVAQFGQIPKGAAKGPEIQKGGMAVERRINADDLFDEDDFDRNFELPILSSLKPKKIKYVNDTIETVTWKHDAVMTQSPHHLYAPPPTKARPSKHLQKLTEPLGFPIPDVSALLSGLNQPANSSIIKLISQINKDNPRLNPDLQVYLPGNRKVHARRDNPVKYGVEAHKLESSYAVQSRRIGSDSYSPAKPKKSGSYRADQQPKLQYERNVPDQSPKRSKSRAVQQPRLESGSFDPVPASRQHEGYDAAFMEGRRSFHNRGRWTRNKKSRAKKPLWSPKIN